MFVLCMQMRHILAGTTKGDLCNRIVSSDSKFTGLLPTANALRKTRQSRRAVVVTHQTILNLVTELGSAIVHFQPLPHFMLILQTPTMVRVYLFAAALRGAEICIG